MTAQQLALPIGLPEPTVLNLTGHVFNVLRNGAWFTPAEIQRAVEHRTGCWHSDSSITARIRDLRKQEYGGYEIVDRKRAGSRAFEYRLEGKR